MPIRINNVVINLEDDLAVVKEKVLKKLNLKEKDLSSFRILKESIDARKKDNIRLTYAVEVNCEQESRLVAKVNDKDVKIEEVRYDAEFEYGTKKLAHRPIIVGMGPAGIFAGLLMAKKGYKPIIIERGQSFGTVEG